MAKHILQAKCFLPMVIQKSTSDAVQNFDICLRPSEMSNKVETLQTKINQENYEKLDPIKPTLHGNVEISRLLTAKKEYEYSFLKAFILDCIQIQERIRLMAEKGHMWLLGNPLSLLRNKHDESFGPLWHEGRPFLKEEAPRPEVSEKSLKKSSALARGKKSEKSERIGAQKVEKKDVETEIKSNVWETIQERSPAWQHYIARRLGALHNTMVQKLP